MFEYMTDSQIAAFIIGIVFSVISIATTCLAIKYAKKFNSMTKAISMALIIPAIAFVAWFFLIFSFFDGFREDEVLNLIVSIIISVILAGMVVIVARALYNKHQDELETEEETIEETTEENENIAESKEENVAAAGGDEDKGDDPPHLPLEDGGGVEA